MAVTSRDSIKVVLFSREMIKEPEYEAVEWVAGEFIWLGPDIPWDLIDGWRQRVEKGR